MWWCTVEYLLFYLFFESFLKIDRPSENVPRRIRRYGTFYTKRSTVKRAINFPTLRKSVGALSRADRPDGANPPSPPSLPSFCVVGDSFSRLKVWRAGVGPLASSSYFLPQYGNACPVADLENPPIEFDEIWHVCRPSESKNFFLLTIWPLDILKVKGQAPKVEGFGIFDGFWHFLQPFTLEKILVTDDIPGAEIYFPQIWSADTPLYLAANSRY